jgi:hypothetical protein
MTDRHTTHDRREPGNEGGEAAEAYRAGEHFGLTPEEERRGTPLQQERAGEVPEIAGDQDEPVPNGPVPGEPERPDPAQPVPRPNDPESDPLQPIPDPDRPDPMRPYPEPGEPDPIRPLPGEPEPPKPL